MIFGSNIVSFLFQQFQYAFWLFYGFDTFNLCKPHSFHFIVHSVHWFSVTCLPNNVISIITYFYFRLFYFIIFFQQIHFRFSISIAAYCFSFFNYLLSFLIPEILYHQYSFLPIHIHINFFLHYYLDIRVYPLLTKSLSYNNSLQQYKKKCSLTIFQYYYTFFLFFNLIFQYVVMNPNFRIHMKLLQDEWFVEKENCFECLNDSCICKCIFIEVFIPSVCNYHTLQTWFSFIHSMYLTSSSNTIPVLWSKSEDDCPSWWIDLLFIWTQSFHVEPWYVRHYALMFSYQKPNQLPNLWNRLHDVLRKLHFTIEINLKKRIHTMLPSVKWFSYISFPCFEMRVYVYIRSNCFLQDTQHF